MGYHSSRSSFPKVSLEAVIIVVILLILFSGVFFSAYFNFKMEHLTAKVTEKQSVVHNKESKYLIFTDKEVLENTDSMIWGKFNSSDYYSRLQVGKTYHMEVCGVRWPVFSMYHNIIKFTETEEEKK